MNEAADVFEKIITSYGMEAPVRTFQEDALAVSARNEDGVSATTKKAKNVKKVKKSRKTKKLSTYRVEVSCSVFYWCAHALAGQEKYTDSVGKMMRSIELLSYGLNCSDDSVGDGMRRSAEDDIMQLKEFLKSHHNQTIEISAIGE